MFTGTVLLNASLIAPALLDDFPVQLPVIPSSAKLFGTFGSVLSILGAAVTVNPEFDEGATAGAILSTIGGIISLIAASSGGSDSTNPAAALADHMNELFSSAKSGVSSLLKSVFDTGNLTQIDKAYTSGAFAPLANYFDKGRFLYALSQVQQSAIENSLNQFMKQNLVGFLLTADHWWILQDAYTIADCPNISSKKGINQHCYTLETFSTGYVAGGSENHNTYSVPVTNNTLTKISKYGIDLINLYNSSRNCQTGSVYGGSVTLTYDEILSSSGTNQVSIPPCFYSLSVLYVQPTENVGKDGLYADNPCAIVQANDTAKARTTIVAGKTFLPDNLVASLQNKKYCCAPEGKGVVCV